MLWRVASRLATQPPRQFSTQSEDARSFQPYRPRLPQTVPHATVKLAPEYVACSKRVAGGAAIFVAVAALSGNRANAPTIFDVLKALSLQKVFEPELFDAGRRIGALRSAEVRLEELVSARKANSRKAQWLNIGFAAHLLVLLCLVAAGVLAVGFTVARP